MKKILIATLLSTCMSSAALAGDFFVEAGVGGSFGKFDGPEFYNPDGASSSNLQSKASGDYILLENVDDTDASFAGSVALGYHVTDNFFTKLSFHSFGSLEASGGARFGASAPGDNYEQVLKTDAYGVFLGGGYQFSVTEQFFVEPNAEIGVAIIKSKGTQGANLDLSSRFPKETRTNLAFGAGVNLGYNLTENLTLLTGANYYWLGKADTGKTKDPEASAMGMNVNEQLQSDLSTITAKVGLRYSF
ncbi:Opacity protein [Pseudovibrio ascidiaceicola]|uniref:Opacity protein n=1 Tax=Pseudovibrio ascidiaceicola TaxID=285279 RepID=A0A1I4DGJ8_9HYPH|nr:outer membrane beta-barrel protein [Pseudovibrio ascidiaceicola]SFK91236.1 Opacity protein [Pseudovibrio ascidiaceicola]